MASGTFKFVPVMGSDNAISKAPIKMGQIYICTDNNKIYFDISDTERILVGQKDSFYKHEQSIASNEWIINHNLNKYPSVTVVDSAGTKIYCDAEYIDANTVKLKFSSEFCGMAYLN